MFLLSLAYSYVLGLTDADIIESLTEHLDLIVAWCHQHQNIHYMSYNNSKIEWKRYMYIYMYMYTHLYYYYYCCYCCCSVVVVIILVVVVRSPHSHTEMANVCITGVTDIEESVWSPRFGLKGKVDATLKMKVREIEKSKKR